MPPHTEPQWPQTSCGAQSGSQLLANVVTKALQQTPPEWTAVYLAGWCAINHTLPVGIPIPPARTACDYAQRASAAANANDWATVKSELNHGGSEPKPAKTIKEKIAGAKISIPKPKKRLPKRKSPPKGKAKPKKKR